MFVLHPAVCCEAYRVYKDAMHLAGKPLDGDLVTRTDAAIDLAATTKAEGVLLRTFATVNDSAPLRTQVQAEMVALRGVVGKLREKKTLHPLVQQRVRDALAFRK